VAGSSRGGRRSGNSLLIGRFLIQRSEEAPYRSRTGVLGFADTHGHYHEAARLSETAPVQGIQAERLPRRPP